MKTEIHNRTDAVNLFLDTIRPLKPFYSLHHAYLHLGNTGVHYGEKSAEMEGFARILWGLGPLWSADNTKLSRETQEEISEWLSRYQEGIIHGTDPDDDEYWGDIFDYDQKMVEVAAIVYAMALNPQKLWSDFTACEQENLYQWLDGMNHHELPACNWRYFRILTNMTFRILNLPWSKSRMKEDFDLIESFYLGDGWYCDGVNSQIDYYVAFAIHFYGLVYAKLMAEMDPERSMILKERSTRFFYDYVYWFANSGEEIPFGRSLTYRYAHAAPFTAMAYAGLDLDYGVLKNLVLKNLESWMKRPIFDMSGILSIGYGYPNLCMSENYNGCGSPYWCNKIFLILGMNEDHPFWQAKCKKFNFQARKFLKQPHMLITHDEHGHVLAYVTGQHLISEHGQGAAKYEKFVYSNHLGFSVSRGTTLQEGAFDNTLAVSAEGENRYCMQYGAEKFLANQKYLYSKSSPLSDVTIETILIPCSCWHVRIHKIVTKRPVDIADGGFALPQENGFKLTKGKKNEKYNAKDVKSIKGALCADFPWGCSCIASETGQKTELIIPAPNTNLFYNLTVIPTVTARLEAGRHLIVTSVGAGLSENSDELMSQKPEVAFKGNQIVVTDGEQINTIDLERIGT